MLAGNIAGGVYLLQQDGAAGRVVRAEIIHADNGLSVACIEVDRNLQIVSSIQGRDSAV